MIRHRGTQHDERESTIRNLTPALVSSSCRGVHVEYRRLFPLPFNLCEPVDVATRSDSCRMIDCSNLAVVFNPLELVLRCGRLRVGVVDRCCALEGRAGRRLPTTSLGLFE